MTEKIVVLITASGRGARFNDNIGIPKQYLPLAGVPLLRHTILAFLNHPKISNVICTIHKDDIELYEDSVLGLDLLDPVFGGDTRQKSVHNGLEVLRGEGIDKILIHDGARPFTSKRVIDGILSKLNTHPAVIPAIVVEDTIKKYGDGKIEWTIERDNLWRAQTPQGFIYEDILNAHNAFKHINFTDDASLDEYAGIPVAIIPGSQNNFKITNKEDYERAKRIISTRIQNVKHEIRCGIGYDVHRLEDAEEPDNNFITLGGIKIKSKKKIISHSDGDIIIHALIDALLGAISKGDIGDYFPSHDPKWKNYSSIKMLEYINYFVLRKYGAKLINLDVTLICQEIKISNLKKDMIRILSKLLKLREDRVNIKATTTDRVGDIGKGIAIAAQAVVSVSIDVLDEN